MKILLITDNFLPHIGGSRIYYYNLCKTLPRGSIAVLTKKIPGYKEFDKCQNFKIYRINFWLLPWKWSRIYELPVYFSLFIYGIFVVLKEKVDIIHCGESLPTGLVGFFLSKLLGKPYIVYTWAEQVTIISRLRTEAKFLRFVLKNADKVIATASFVERSVKQLGVDPKKIVKILQAVDSEFLEDKQVDVKGLKQAFGIEGKKVLLTATRLIKRKGVDKVIEALAEVIKKVPNIIYLIAGEGPEENTLKKIVESKNLDMYMRFFGKVSHIEMPLYYNICDLFILPNLQLSDGDTDGLATVFIEANAFGKPVIGGKAGGTEDAIIDGMTGLIVDGNNVNEIAKGIINLLTNEDYAKRLGEAGKQRVRNEFRLEDRANEIYAISKGMLIP